LCRNSDVYALEPANATKTNSPSERPLTGSQHSEFGLLKSGSLKDGIGKVLASRFIDMLVAWASPAELLQMEKDSLEAMRTLRNLDNLKPED
jgi:hypothetical protein